MLEPLLASRATAGRHTHSQTQTLQSKRMASQSERLRRVLTRLAPRGAELPRDRRVFAQVPLRSARGPTAPAADMMIKRLNKDTSEPRRTKPTNTSTCTVNVLSAPNRHVARPAARVLRDPTRPSPAVSSGCGHRRRARARMHGATARARMAQRPADLPSPAPTHTTPRRMQQKDIHDPDPLGATCCRCTGRRARRI